MWSPWFGDPNPWSDAPSCGWGSSFSHPNQKNLVIHSLFTEPPLGCSFFLLSISKPLVTESGIRIIQSQGPISSMSWVHSTSDYTLVVARNSKTSYHVTLPMPLPGLPDMKKETKLQELGWIYNFTSAVIIWILKTKLKMCTKSSELGLLKDIYYFQ